MLSKIHLFPPPQYPEVFHHYVRGNQEQFFSIVSVLMETIKQKAKKQKTKPNKQKVICHFTM